jgi:hypothetical protein
MRVWSFTVALFLAVMGWDSEQLADDGRVRTMDGPIWPPR